VAEQQKTIFREKSVDRVSSPEQLDKYIKTTNPSLWIIFAAIIVFLAGVIAWGVFGNLKTNSSTGFVVENGKAYCYIKESDYEKLVDDSYFEINGNKYEITKVEGPMQVSSETDAYIIHAAGISVSDWYYIVYGNINLPQGQYKGKVVFELTSPIKFVIN